MRDIERELRALGERAESGTSQDAHVPRGLLNRIRLARFLTAGAAIVVALAVAGGGTLAARSLGEEPELRPAEVDVPQGPPTALFSTYRSQRVIVTLMPVNNMACYGGESLGDSVQRIEIEAVSGDPVITLFPAEEGSTVSRERIRCVSGQDELVLQAIADDPSAYAFAVSGPNGREISPLVRFEDSEADPSCFEVSFEPTFLPDGWSKELQARSAVGADDDNVVGHYANEARPGSDRKNADGFADLVVNDRPYSGADEPELTVLGSPADLERRGDGAYLSFGFEGCSYTLFMFLLSEKEMVRFAEGLRPTSVPAEDLSHVFVGITEEGSEVTATMRIGTDEVCFEIPDALDYRAAHLHLEDGKESGEPIVATLFDPSTEPSTEGCAPTESIDEEAIPDDPTGIAMGEHLYVDLHISEDESVVLKLNWKMEEAAPLLEGLQTTDWTQPEPYGLDLEIVPGSEQAFQNLLGSVGMYHFVEEGPSGERSSGAAVRILFYVFPTFAEAEAAASEYETRSLETAESRRAQGISQYCLLFAGGEECVAVSGVVMMRVVSALPEFDISEEFQTGELMGLAFEHLEEVRRQVSYRKVP